MQRVVCCAGSSAVAEHSRWAVEELRRELVKSTDTHTAGGQGGSSIFTVQSLQVSCCWWVCCWFLLLSLDTAGE
jgi:hypothetical protein